MKEYDEYDTRGDTMIIQDNRRRSFGELTILEEDDTSFRYNIRITKGNIMSGTHTTQFLRPFNILTDGIAKSLS